MPRTILESWPFIVSAARIEPRPTTQPTERSSDAPRITSVWPAATMPSATERTNISRTLSTLRNSLVPPSWIVTAIRQAMKTTIRTMNTGPEVLETRRRQTSLDAPDAPPAGAAGGRSDTVLIREPPRAARPATPSPRHARRWPGT